jgi:gamma-glutamylcyclotransferase
MNHDQMYKRCPGSKFITKAYLKGYKFTYDGYSVVRKGAVANIILSPRNIVWGGLYEINDEHRNSLDLYEGYPRSYDRMKVQVFDEEDNVFDVITYYRAPQKKGEPSPDYKNCVIEGAKNCCLPANYIKENL